MVMICDDQENTNLLNCKMRQRHICPLRSGQSNMSQLVLTLLIHQVAFDPGRRKGERVREEDGN